MPIKNLELRRQRRTLSSLHRPIAAVLLMSVAAACKEKKPPPRPTPVVAITKAHRGPLPYLVVAPGQVEASRTVDVVAQVGGMLKRVAFAEGDEVKAGQVLFEIDQRPFKADLERASSNMDRDVAQLAQAKAVVARYSALAKDGYTTREQMDQVNANAAALEATVSADRAVVDASRLALDQATVHAPIGGRTGQLSIREGNVVRALATPPLVTINEVKPVKVKFAISERDFTEMRRRSGVDAPLDVAIRPSTSSDSGFPIRGKLAFIDNAIDRATGTVTLKALVPNLDGALWTGQFVNVALELAVDTAAVTVPTQAVVTSQSGTFVFLVNDDKKVKRVPVKVGRTSGLSVMIEDGLSGGETVITDGQKLLNDGVTVEIRSASGAPTEGRGGRGRGRGTDSTAGHRGPGSDSTGGAGAGAGAGAGKGTRKKKGDSSARGPQR